MVVDTDNTIQNDPDSAWAHRPRWMDYAITLVLEAGLTAGLWFLLPVFEIGRFPICYILLTMLVAYFFGVGPAILSVVVGWVAFTQFFVEPPGLWPVAASPIAWARQAALFLGLITISIAAIQVKKA